MKSNLPKLTQATVRTILRGLGVSFKSLPESGELCVGGSYFTDDLQDALDTGRAIVFKRDAKPDTKPTATKPPVWKAVRTFIANAPCQFIVTDKCWKGTVRGVFATGADAVRFAATLNS
jgi:hypothetical protein